MSHTDTKLKIYLNREEDADGRLAIFSRLRDEEAYHEGDRLELVWEGAVAEAPDDEVLNQAFGMFNRGASNFVGDDAYPQRSLSVGDVVEVDSHRYACEPVGWKKLS